MVEHPPAAVGRDRARGDAAGVILLVQPEPKRQVVGHALIDRDEARAVRAEEEDLPARDVEADHDSAEEHERERPVVPRAPGGGWGSASLAARGRRGRTTVASAGTPARRARGRGRLGGRANLVGAQRPGERGLVAGARRVSGRTLLQLVTRQAEQHDGDVVLAAALVRGPHQRFGGLLGVLGRPQDRGQLVVRDHAGEPIRAEQEDVALAPAIVYVSTSTSGSGPSARVMIERCG